MDAPKTTRNKNHHRGHVRMSSKWEITGFGYTQITIKDPKADTTLRGYISIQLQF